VNGGTGGITVMTTITVANPLESSASVVLATYLNTGGTWKLKLASAELGWGAVSDPPFLFNLGPRQSAVITSSGTEALTVGWALLESTGPIEVAATYHLITSDFSHQVLSEAGVLPTPLHTSFSFFATVSKDEPAPGTDVNTGLAIVNPNAVAVDLAAVLFTSTGALAGLRSLPLCAGCQTALFVPELFNTTDFTHWSGAWHGTVRLASALNIGVMAMRQTAGGSSLLSSVAVNPDTTLQRHITYEREPNDQLYAGQAVPVLPAELVGTLNSSTDSGTDTDVYEVTLKKGDNLLALVTAKLAGSSAFPYLAVYQFNGVQLGRASFITDPALPDAALSITNIPQDGKYLVVIGSETSSSPHQRDASYRINVFSYTPAPLP
jgi:hypothetical protein